MYQLFADGTMCGTVPHLRTCYLITGFLLICSSGVSEANNSTTSTTSTNITNNAAGDVAEGGRIVGGVAVNIEDYPWQISLQYKSRSDMYHMCGGSILSKRWIITAAHCVEGMGRKRLRVVAKITRLDETYASVSKVKKVISHSNYSPYTLDNDIAVLRLSRNTRIQWDEKAVKVDLPTQEQDFELDDQTELHVTGWGTLSFGGPSPNQLQSAVINYVPTANCSDAYAGGITNNMMCAAAFGKDSCQGDSGGPLVIKDTKTLVGIVSWGEECAKPDYPGVYTRVSQYIDWIKAKTNIG